MRAIELLGKQHERDRFDCGNEVFKNDDWKDAQVKLWQAENKFL